MSYTVEQVSEGASSSFKLQASKLSIQSVLAAIAPFARSEWHEG